MDKYYSDRSVLVYCHDIVTLMLIIWSSTVPEFDHPCPSSTPSLIMKKVVKAEQSWIFLINCALGNY